MVFEREVREYLFSLFQLLREYSLVSLPQRAQVPICWNKSWISCEDEKEEEKEEDKHLGKEEAKRILRGLGGAVLDHISKPYDEDEVVQEEEEEIREEEEEILMGFHLK